MYAWRLHWCYVDLTTMSRNRPRSIEISFQSNSHNKFVLSIHTQSQGKGRKLVVIWLLLDPNTRYTYVSLELFETFKFRLNILKYIFSLKYLTMKRFSNVRFRLIWKKKHLKNVKKKFITFGCDVFKTCIKIYKRFIKIILKKTWTINLSFSMFIKDTGKRR